MVIFLFYFVLTIKKLCLFRETVKVLVRISHLCVINWRINSCWVCCLLPHVLGLVVMMLYK